MPGELEVIWLDFQKHASNHQEMFDCKMQNDTAGIAFFKDQENLNSVFSEGLI